MTSRIGNPPPRGFTLMEMLLVLAIMVAVAAMVLPALRGSMEDQQLRKAADLIRADWATLRVTAMRTGRIQLFRYDVGANTYTLETWQGDADDAELQASATAAPEPTMTVGQNSDSTNGLASAGLGTLPSNITFNRGEVASDARSAQVDGAASNPSASSSGSSPMIVFYTDGTTTDASLVLTNERFFVELRLRGLTGQSQASDLLSQQEIKP
ncbi:MAG: prepilin-type N-terminal cleavage/methylation domain-containing protein [Planctomycetota bacterium]|nr:prepilin-type N-terminal cleavage/methylation domain-containing protein [Planctomycetota bacterium]